MPADATALPILPVILCGGSGTRLWPLSRSLYPKQLLPITGSASMLQETARRIADDALFEAPLCVANEEHRFFVVRQLAALGMRAQNILLEQEGRNTAPAIALAALWAMQQGRPDQLLLILPSDHVIADTSAFRRAVLAARPAAACGALVTFGMRPERAETGYGYIAQGAPWPMLDGVYRVARFIEKPDAQTAEKLCDGKHYWNSGMFLFTARHYLAALAIHAPDIYAACRLAMAEATQDSPFLRPNAKSFAQAPKISIDYAVMEKTDAAALVPVNMGWSDVGSWAALWDISLKDRHGVVAVGAVTAVACRNSLLRSENGPAIAAIGMEDMIIVATRDAVLVAPRARAQEIGALVDQLKAEDNPLAQLPATVHRPWGSYEQTDCGPGFQTKRIIVEPGEKLSLQKHAHRAEHWIIVAGTARVTIDEEIFLLHANQSAYIPAGSLHRLENPLATPLHLIEVQCGDYLGEDDIIRVEDIYGRAENFSAIPRPDLASRAENQGSWSQ